MPTSGAQRRATLDDIASHLELYATNTAVPAASRQGQQVSSGKYQVASGNAESNTSNSQPSTPNTIQGIAPQMKEQNLKSQISNSKSMEGSVSGNAVSIPSSDSRPPSSGILDAVFGIFKKKPKQRLARVPQTVTTSPQIPNNKSQIPNNSGAIGDSSHLTSNSPQYTHF